MRLHELGQSIQLAVEHHDAGNIVCERSYTSRPGHWPESGGTVDLNYSAKMEFQVSVAITTTTLVPSH